MIQPNMRKWLLESADYIEGLSDEEASVVSGPYYVLAAEGKFQSSSYEVFPSEMSDRDFIC